MTALGSVVGRAGELLDEKFVDGDHSWFLGGLSMRAQTARSGLSGVGVPYWNEVESMRRGCECVITHGTDGMSVDQ